MAPRRAGRSPELESPHTLAWLGRLLGRLHAAVGARRPFEHRRTLDCDSYGTQARDRVAQSGLLTDAQSAAWLGASGHAVDAARAAFEAAGPLRRLRLHGDCHPGNILWREEGDFAGPLFVDLDDACMGPAVQDLWMLLSGDRDAMQVQLSHVLGGYRAFMDFNSAELGLIEPLRALRMIHHSAWIADRWDDPAFPAAFPWFGTPAYWDQQTTQLREARSSTCPCRRCSALEVAACTVGPAALSAATARNPAAHGQQLRPRGLARRPLAAEHDAAVAQVQPSRVPPSRAGSG